MRARPRAGEPPGLGQGLVVNYNDVAVDRVKLAVELDHVRTQKLPHSRSPKGVTPMVRGVPLVSDRDRHRGTLGPRAPERARPWRDWD